MRKYKLFYRDTCIAVVNEIDSDFPNLYGEFTVTAGRLPSDVEEYIKYSIKHDELMDNNEEEGISFMEENEHKFQTLIDSNEWYLIDESGKKEKILIPIIYKGRITWRWNFED